MLVRNFTSADLLEHLNVQISNRMQDARQIVQSALKQVPSFVEARPVGGAALGSGGGDLDLVCVFDKPTSVQKICQVLKSMDQFSNVIPIPARVPIIACKLQ